MRGECVRPWYATGTEPRIDALDADFKAPLFGICTSIPLLHLLTITIAAFVIRRFGVVLVTQSGTIVAMLSRFNKLRSHYYPGSGVFGRTGLLRSRATVNVGLPVFQFDLLRRSPAARHMVVGFLPLALWPMWARSTSSRNR